MEAATRFYLEHTVQLTRDGMIELIIGNGYNSSRALITKKDDFVSKMCSYIRKSAGTAAERPDKNITVETEHRLSRLQLFTKYCYMTEREVDLNTGPTLEVLDSIGTTGNSGLGSWERMSSTYFAQEQKPPWIRSGLMGPASSSLTPFSFQG